MSPVEWQWHGETALTPVESWSGGLEMLQERQDGAVMEGCVFSPPKNGPNVRGFTVGQVLNQQRACGKG